MVCSRAWSAGDHLRPGLIYAVGWNIEEEAAASFVVIFFAALSSILRNTRGESPVDWRAAALL